LVNEDAVSYSNQTESMVDDDFELPQWQKDVIDKRLEDLEKNPDSFISYDAFLEKYGKI
jgi:hypothetical protein